MHFQIPAKNDGTKPNFFMNIWFKSIYVNGTVGQVSDAVRK